MSPYNLIVRLKSPQLLTLKLHILLKLIKTINDYDPVSLDKINSYKKSN